MRHGFCGDWCSAALVTVACGPSGAEDGSDSHSGSDGGEPRCSDVEIESGIAGRTDERTCDIEGDCVSASVGTPVDVHDQDPQIGSDDLVICANGIVVSDADPLHEAFYETGNGSSWSVRSCQE